MKTPVLAIAATATFLTGAPALAGQDRAQTMVVQFADLDLSTSVGQETLQTRIDAAAKKYCGSDARTAGTPLSASKTQICVREVKTIAARKVDALMEETRLGG